MDYLFEDNDIKNELENYHIRKSSYTQAIVLLNDDEVLQNIQDLVDNSKSGGDNELMNAYTRISDCEVKATFGRGSDTPGSDGLSARLIDRASRGQMEECLFVL